MDMTKLLPEPLTLARAVIVTALASVIFSLIVSKVPPLKKLVKDYETS